MTHTKLILTAATAVTVLALSACGGNDTSEPANGAPETTQSSSATATHDGTDGKAEASSSEHSEADVMFAQMMMPHHEQAIEMSDIILSKDDIPADVVALAEEIQAAQGPEIQQLTDWLEQWGEPVEPQDDGGGHDMSTMEGMLSDDELQQLRDAQGTDAARIFMEQMIAHHEGAVTMAEDEVADGTYQPAIDMAHTIITTQQQEIDEMRDMLNSL
ncbi:DUF305 domain-containing protein [Dietzia alimentaria]|uniref:DUF305 domain-containing protein n=1 Tax=Dietzia alimentaria TaxID=665550 RepID=UPI00029AD25E|nr:DUF305 domain-containing protein [Dietzia alimentaria]